MKFSSDTKHCTKAKQISLLARPHKKSKIKIYRENIVRSRKKVMKVIDKDKDDEMNQEVDSEEKICALAIRLVFTRTVTESG